MGKDQRPEQLLHAADLAMYEAKDGGKARFEVFEKGMAEGAFERLELENALRRAANHPDREFEIHYQPRVSLMSGRVVGMEALLRWRHPGRGLVSPGEFIPLAEQTGLILPVGRWVLEEACRQGREWQDRYPDVDLLWISVNLSGRQLKYPGEIADDIGSALKKGGLRPANLSLEITETALVEDVASAVGALGRLKELGVRVEIDDFGTGYSSLSYLKRIPADFLKIDNSFVDTLGEEDAEVDETITGAVVSLAHALDLKVVGEGVETSGQLERLRALGCDLGQGYYFSKPLPTEEVEALLDENPRW